MPLNLSIVMNANVERGLIESHERFAKETMPNTEHHNMRLREGIPLDKLRWQKLSSNPNASHILEKNLDKVDWWGLSSNPNAIHLLEKNLDKVVGVVYQSKCDSHTITRLW